MESFLIPMESLEPKIHVLYTIIGTLFYKLMTCFVKKPLLMEPNKNIRKEARELGNLDLSNSQHLKTVHDIEVGTRSKYLIANLESSENLDLLKVEFRSCYQIITKYLQTRFPKSRT